MCCEEGEVGTITVCGQDMVVCENCDKGGDGYNGFLDQYDFCAETSSYEEKVVATEYTTTATPGGGTQEEQQQATHVEEPYDADSEDEWEFENFAHSVENGVDHYLVAGGGMMNGNAYAEVVVYPLLKKVCYVEHGKYGTVTTYRNSTLKWDTEGRAVCFDIVAINS